MSTKKETKVYKYIDRNNPKHIEYWKVTTDPKINKILTESFTTDLRLYNIFEEVLTNDGAELILYTDFEKNNDGQNLPVIGKIVDNDVYKWNGTDKYKYSVIYNSSIYGQQQFTKKRAKINFDNIIINLKNYSTLKFMDEYTVESMENKESYEFYQLTYYANGIGMVKYQRYLPNETTIELELHQILSEKEFNNLMKKANR